MPDKGKHPERIRRLEHIFQLHDVKLAYVFGSMAEPVRAFLVGGPLNVSDPLADIDIGVVFEDAQVLAHPALRRERYARVFNDLTEMFPEERLDLVFCRRLIRFFSPER